MFTRTPSPRRGLSGPGQQLTQHVFLAGTEVLDEPGPADGGGGVHALVEYHDGSSRRAGGQVGGG